MKELWEEINDVQGELETSLQSLKQNGEIYAEAKRQYYIRLRQEELYLRNCGYPVTLIPDMARGEHEVASLRFEKDKAEVIYDANRDALNVCKLKLRVLTEQFTREYTKQ